MMDVVAQVNWSKETNLQVDGIPLIPTVVVDVARGIILGHAYSSRRSLELAIQHGLGIYFSRSRKSLWFKSPSGRNSQRLVSVQLDCDKDSLLFNVLQRGEGFCHTGTISCFGNKYLVNRDSTIRIAYCTGRMESVTLNLLSQALGVRLFKEALGRSFSTKIEALAYQVTLLPLKPTDTGKALAPANPLADVLFCHGDRLPSTLNNLFLAIPSIGAIDVSVVSRRGWKWPSLSSTITLASEYPDLSSEWLRSPYLEATKDQVKQISVHGGADSMVASGSCDLAVTVVNTGETLQANNLSVYHVLEQFPFGVYFTEEAYRRWPRFFRELRNYIADDSIYFYSVDDSYGFMSNFFPSPFTDDHGTAWTTVEHYYQAHKFTSDMKLFEAVRLQATAKDCYKFSWAHKDSFRADWSSVKDTVMKKALLFKFTQHPGLMRQLMDTSPKKLVEHSLRDFHYGCGIDGSGLNMLGNMLMELRDGRARL